MSEQVPQAVERDYTTFVEILVRGWPLAVIFVGAIVCFIDAQFGETKFVKGVNTGRMDGAAENFVSEPEFDGDRGNIQSEAPLTLEGDSVDGVYIDPQFGHCIDINTDRWGYSAYYDPEKAEVETAWAAMQKLELIGSLGEEVVVIQGDVVRMLTVDSSELNSLANLTTICE